MRPQVWKEGRRFKVRTDLSLTSVEDAHKAVLTALVARDLADPGALINLSWCGEEDGKVFYMTDVIPPRNPMGYRPRIVEVGSHVEVLDQNQSGHNFAIGDVVEVTYVYPDSHAGQISARGMNRRGVMVNQYLLEGEFRLTDAPLTEEIQTESEVDSLAPLSIWDYDTGEPF